MACFIQDAFNAVCDKAKNVETWHVVLMESVQFYGGPEEGGWYGTDSHVIAFQEFPSQELADAAADKVRLLAEELSQQSKKEYGDQCLRELDWLDARGLEADYLPEPDGPASYYVTVSQGIPENRRGDRQYS